jgi:hypothetical protein
MAMDRRLPACETAPQEDRSWLCCIWSVCGMVKSRHSLASDRQGQLVERGRQAPSHWFVDRELVVASS